MNPTSTPSAAQTLVAALLGGISAAADNQAAVTLGVQPLPATGYGYAGIGQYGTAATVAPTTAVNQNQTAILIVIAVVALVLVLGRA